LYIHAVAEALKLCFADRERYYGDAKEGGVPLRELLAPAYLRERAKLIRMDRAAPEQPAAGDPRTRGSVAGVAPRRAGEAGAPPAAGGTPPIAASHPARHTLWLTPTRLV